MSQTLAGKMTENYVLTIFMPELMEFVSCAALKTRLKEDGSSPKRNSNKVSPEVRLTTTTKTPNILQIFQEYCFSHTFSNYSKT